MSLTNIAALFSDIVETPQQRQQRLLAEGQASARQFTGLPTGIRELAMGISSNIPRNVEAVRRFGVQAGLPMQTQGEQLQRVLGGIDTSTESGRKEAVRVLAQFDPILAAQLADVFRQRGFQERETTAEEQRAAAAVDAVDVAREEARIAGLRAETAQQQVELGEKELLFNTDVQTDLSNWRETQAQDADEDIALRREALEMQERLAQLRRDELGAGDRRAMRVIETEVGDMRDQANLAQALAAEYEAVESSSAGTVGRISEWWKRVMGAEDRRTGLLAAYNKLRNSIVMDNLPPGAASDKDIEVAMAGFLPADANEELISQFLRGMQKISWLAAEKENERLKFYMDNGAVGVMTQITRDEFGNETEETVTFEDIWLEKIKDDAYLTLLEEKSGNTLDFMSGEERAAFDQAAADAAAKAEEAEIENARRMEQQRINERAAARRSGGFNTQI